MLDDLLIASTTGRPYEIFGTNWPSIISRWKISAPASSMVIISSPNLEKSLANNDKTTLFTSIPPVAGLNFLINLSITVISRLCEFTRRHRILHGTLRFIDVQAFPELAPVAVLVEIDASEHQIVLVDRREFNRAEARSICTKATGYFNQLDMPRR